MAARGENVVGILGLFLIQLAKQFLLQDFRETNDGVEWGSKLMGHVGEEFRLVSVSGLDLPALILDLAEQPGVLDREGRLRREGLKQVDDLRGKVARLLAPDRQGTHDPLFPEQRNRQNRSIPEPRENRPHSRSSRLTLLQDVRN